MKIVANKQQRENVEHNNSKAVKLQLITKKPKCNLIPIYSDNLCLAVTSPCSNLL